MLFGAGLTRPVPGQRVTREGIPEPGTPGEAAASAAFPSKAGGLGRKRGKYCRARANARRMGEHKLPLRAAALVLRRTTTYPIGFCCAL